MSPFNPNNYRRSEKRILGALVFIALSLCAVALISNRNSKRIAASTAEVQKSENTKFDIEKIVSVSADLETGARGYVITGDEKYLEPTNRAIGNIFTHIDHVKNASKGNAAQLKRITELEDLVDRKISISTRAVELRRNKGFEQAMAFITSGEGTKVMDDIGRTTTRMLDEENVALQKRSEENKRNFADFSLTFNLLLTGIALILIAVFFVLRYYFRARNWSEENLRENKQLLQAILDNNTSVISVKDLNGQYLMINRSFEDLYQVKKEEVKGKTDYDLFPKETADLIHKTDGEVIAGKKPVQFEEDIPNNGEMRHYFSTRFPLFDNKRLIYAICTSATDITERKQMDEMEKSRSEQIHELFNNAPCGYLSTDRNGLIMEMNDTELKWLGYTRDEMVGKIPTQDLLTKDSMSVFAYFFPKLRSGEMKSLRDVEIRFKRKDGSTFPALINTVAVYDVNGKFLNTRTSVFDISHMKKPESVHTPN